MRKCPNCGAQNNDKNIFCTDCGNPIPQGNEKQDVKEKTQGNPFSLNSSSKKVLPKIIGFVAVVIIGFLVWNSYNTNLDDGKKEKKDIFDSFVESQSTGFNSKENDIQLIKEWYDLVLSDGKSPTENDLNEYLSSTVKKKLWTDDYEGCYMYWRFRTTAQDSNSDSDVSKIESITSKGDMWYEVKYLDMGWAGTTNVKVQDNKIVDFKADKSWDDWDNPVEVDTDYSNSSNVSSDDSYSRTQLIFSNEQYIISHLLNQRFRHSSGLEIRFDGDGRMYIDGDAAGVISVIRYNSESAILRYGNGLYGEGKLFMQYANGRIQLTDTADGSVFYQK